MSQYSVTIQNNSVHSSYFMIFQNDPAQWDPDAMAVAWFSKYSNPNQTVKFSWDVEWGFSWADIGTIQPGIRYEESECYEPKNGRTKVTLDYNGAYQFVDKVVGRDPARLYLEQSRNIPIRSSASVGVTMSGKPVYVTQARPNNSLTFSPHPSYFLAYGTYQEGTVIDVSTVNNILELRFPTDVFNLTTTLNADDSWEPVQ